MSKPKADGQQKSTALKKGEPGYWDRNTTGLNTPESSEKIARANAAFETAEEFTEAAERYFADADDAGELYGEAGLCLGLTRHNRKGRRVTLRALQDWYDGTSCPWLQEAVQMAYLRIQRQVETDARYMDKGGMTSRAIFLQKQKRLGGYEDKPSVKADATVTILWGGQAPDKRLGE